MSQGPSNPTNNHTSDYWSGNTHIYVETLPNGDELISEYGNGWQRAYSRPKELLEYWKKQAKSEEVSDAN